MKPPPARPIAFVVAATAHGSMLVNIHDHADAGNGRTYGVGDQILRNAVYDPREVGLVLQLLEARRANFGDGVVMVDCGANIGVHTIEGAKFMHGWGSVLAFEAQERLFYALAGNIALNNCFNARAIWAAVGAERGTIAVPVPDYFTPSSFGSLELRRGPRTEYIGQAVDYSPEKGSVTEMTSIDALDLDRLDFLKIDVEGMEAEVLAGARASVEKLRPLILVERIKSNEAELTGMLQPLGYTLFTVGLNLLAVHADDPFSERIKPA